MGVLTSLSLLLLAMDVVPLEAIECRNYCEGMLIHTDLILQAAVRGRHVFGPRSCLRSQALVVMISDLQSTRPEEHRVA